MDYRISHYSQDDFLEVDELWTLLKMGGAERGDNSSVINATLQNGGVLFIMRIENRLIGTAWLTNDMRRLYLHHMGIHPDFQNKGLGKQLLGHCLNWAKAQCLQIKLEVNPANLFAVKLYENSGFKRLGDYDVYIIRSYSNI